MADENWVFATNSDSVFIRAKTLIDIVVRAKNDDSGIICFFIEDGDLITVVTFCALEGRLQRFSSVEGLDRTRLQSLLSEPMLTNDPLPGGSVNIIPRGPGSTVEVDVAGFHCFYVGSSNSNIVACLRERPLGWMSQSLFDKLRNVDLRRFFGDDVPSRLHGLPWFWELFGFALPWRVRKETFEPMYYELLTDYLETRHERFQTPLVRRWINLCFTLRTFGLLLECITVGLSSRAWLVLICLIPLGFRNRIWEWWSQLFR